MHSRRPNTRAKPDKLKNAHALQTALRLESSGKGLSAWFFLFFGHSMQTT